MCMYLGCLRERWRIAGAPQRPGGRGVESRASERDADTTALPGESARNPPGTTVRHTGMHVAPFPDVNELTPEDIELTPTCDPPLRASPGAPIGTSWWIEPSHPEVDPTSALLTTPAGDEPPDGQS
jgi:hypothetical protein